MGSNLKPIHDRVVVEPEIQQATPSGIVLPDTASERPQEGTVVAVEDALHATRAAVEEGILPGGATALLRASGAVGRVALDGDQKLGAEILKRALDASLRQLVANTGLEGSVDLVQAGIIDPAKVTRSALGNAGSVSGMILTTEALVTELPEKEPASANAAPGGADR